MADLLKTREKSGNLHAYMISVRGSKIVFASI